MNLERMNVKELAEIERRIASAKAKTVDVKANISKRMKIGGGDVADAKEPLPVKITKNDVRLGAMKSAKACAAAQALCRQNGFTEARVHAARTYVKRPDGKWLRYVTPPSLRAEIVAFDRGGTFEPGEYSLLPVQPSQTIGARSKRKGYDRGKGKEWRDARGKDPNRPKRKNHVTTGIRSRFLPS